MKDFSAELADRVAREREAWNTNGIVKAQSWMKSRFIAAFNNPHRWKMEERRRQIIRERCLGSTVLDYGCFDGRESRQYLEYGARKVIGIDISDGAIVRARDTILDSRAEFYISDAHFLPFGSESFDLIVGRAILHHLHLKTAFKEIARVLKPGGLATFVEPLRGNPGAKMLRLLTPKARTPDELPLDARDIAMGDQIIGPGSHTYSGFVSTPIGMVVSLFRRDADNRIMRIASRGDDLINNTPFRFWGRLGYLYFQKPCRN